MVGPKNEKLKRVNQKGRFKERVYERDDTVMNDPSWPLGDLRTLREGGDIGWSNRMTLLLHGMVS